MKWALAASLFAVLCQVDPASAACVLDGGRCNVCGCKGGPGYRSFDTRKCVSFAELHDKCGDPPTTCCLFENAPETGGNRDCALETVASQLFQIEDIQALPEIEVDRLRDLAFEALRAKAKESGQCQISD